MWVVELNIVGFQIRRHVRKRRHLLRLGPSPAELRFRTSGAA